MATVVSPSYIGVPQRIIAAQKAEGCSTSNHFAFEFAYNLAEHPLFQVSRLVQLANFIARKDPNKVTRVAMEANPRGCDWSGRMYQTSSVKPDTRSQEAGLMLLINDAHKDPDYQALLDQIVDELEELTGQSLQQKHTWLENYIFISPLSSVTNFDLPHEENFLSQIHQEKEVPSKRNKHSIFISLIYFSGKAQKVNLNSFTLRSNISKYKK